MRTHPMFGCDCYAPPHVMALQEASPPCTQEQYTPRTYVYTAYLVPIIVFSHIRKPGDMPESDDEDDPLTAHVYLRNV